MKELRLKAASTGTTEDMHGESMTTVLMSEDIYDQWKVGLRTIRSSRDSVVLHLQEREADERLAPGTVYIVTIREEISL